MRQLTIFDKIEESPPQSQPKQTQLSYFDELSTGLDELNRMSDDFNKMLQGMLDKVQANWSEEEKLKINNPKKWEELYSQQQTKIETTEMATKIDDRALQVLKQCKVDGLNVSLPEGQLERTVYTDVKKALELIGGKWKGGKTQAFVFQSDPTDMLAEIAAGENRNLKKEFQFFATPKELARRLVQLAEISGGDTILEPSAGQGAIIEAIQEELWSLDLKTVVSCYELMPVNRVVLKKMEGIELLGEDFLDAKETKKYDIIIANPPFAKNQDIEHLYKMWAMLAPGGRVVCVMSNHWLNSSTKACCDFKAWISLLNAKMHDIEPGTFKESGTMVGAKIVVIDKYGH
jgi:type I restriction-modification system DNA methylase subunit